jgi:hypothetical protein
VFYEEGAWDASATWYNAEVAESERDGDGTPWSATPHFEGCGSKGNNNNNNNNNTSTTTTTTSSSNNNNNNGGGIKNATCATVKDVVEESISSLGALLDQYRVDIYAAGHVHSFVPKPHPCL